jgi:hypothetical protein
MMIEQRVHADVRFDHERDMLLNGRRSWPTSGAGIWR